MIVLQVLAAALAIVPSALPPQRVVALPPCSVGQLSFAFDGEGGQFDGMSHSGTLFIARNIGPQACRLPALPQLAFEDAAGRVLPAARRAPPGMHPGPVLLPVALAPGAEATAAMRWVSGDVYDGHNCIAPAKVRITVQGASAVEDLTPHICGPAGKPVPYDQPPLKTDPVLRAGP